MAKGKREKIKLESTAGTGHFYTTSKNRTNTPKKPSKRPLRKLSSAIAPSAAVTTE